MRIFKDFGEIKAAVGTEVVVSDWIEVTQKRIDQFARATGDDQWIHVDVERAQRELCRGTTIAHGLLTLSFAPVFVRSVMCLEGVKNTLNYGANRIRYLAPVPTGSRVPDGSPSRLPRTRRAMARGSPMVLPLRSKPRASGLYGRTHRRALPLNAAARPKEVSKRQGVNT
ncbi:MaoC family dehydratase [Microvirga aerophila]|nr:MaoC family dehydratase [Microvirga aerophila]